MSDIHDAIERENAKLRRAVWWAISVLSSSTDAMSRDVAAELNRTILSESRPS